MTKKDYIALINEFNLTYDADTTSAYFKEFPICGYRSSTSSYGYWRAKSLIIFENYNEHLNEYGHFTGMYQDKYATKVVEARKLIANQIIIVKNKFIDERLAKMKKDF